MWEKSCQIVLSSKNRRNASSAGGVSRSSTAIAPCSSNCAVSAAAIRPLVDGAARDLGRGAQMDRRVVVLAQHVDLRIGQRDDLVRDLLRDLAVVARQQFEAQTVARSLRQIEKLLGIVLELVARRRRQRLQRDGGPVIAAPQLVGARKMIERPPPLALRQPEEAERAMRLVVLRLERAARLKALIASCVSPSAISATARL